MKATIKLTVYQDSEYGPFGTPIPFNQAVSICYEPKFDPKEIIKKEHERALGWLCEELRAWLDREFADRMSEAPITSINDLLADINRRLEHENRKEGKEYDAHATD